MICFHCYSHYISVVSSFANINGHLNSVSFVRMWTKVLCIYALDLIVRLGNKRVHFWFLNGNIWWVWPKPEHSLWRIQIGLIACDCAVHTLHTLCFRVSFFFLPLQFVEHPYKTWLPKTHVFAMNVLNYVFTLTQNLKTCKRDCIAKPSKTNCRAQLTQLHFDFCFESEIRENCLLLLKTQKTVWFRWRDRENRKYGFFSLVGCNNQTYGRMNKNNIKPLLLLLPLPLPTSLREY